MKKRDYFKRYGDQTKKVLEAMLDKYADEGIENIEDIKILTVNPFDEIGIQMEIVSLFVGKNQHMMAVTNLELAMYNSA